MITAESFTSAFRLHPSGVALITAEAGGPIALTASSLSSVSASPPMLMFSVAATSSSAEALRLADTVVVHLLSASNLDLAMLGAARGVDRFADESLWHRLDTGEPVFHGARTWLRSRILHRIDAGGSTVFIATAIDAQVADDSHVDDGLVYRNRVWHRIDDTSETSQRHVADLVTR